MSRSRKRSDRFTGQQIAVMEGLSQGLGYPEIGEKLGISPKTAKNYASQAADVISPQTRHASGQVKTILATYYLTNIEDN